MFWFLVYCWNSVSPCIAVWLLIDLYKHIRSNYEDIELLMIFHDSSREELERITNGQ